MPLAHKGSGGRSGALRVSGIYVVSMDHLKQAFEKCSEAGARVSEDGDWLSLLGDPVFVVLV